MLKEIMKHRPQILLWHSQRMSLYTLFPVPQIWFFPENFQKLKAALGTPNTPQCHQTLFLAHTGALFAQSNGQCLEFCAGKDDQLCRPLHFFDHALVGNTLLLQFFHAQDKGR